MGNCYHNRINGFVLDFQKAVELFQRASKLGCAAAHHAIGNAHAHGKGVEKDMKKTVRHFQDSAIILWASSVPGSILEF